MTNKEAWAAMWNLKEGDNVLLVDVDRDWRALRGLHAKPPPGELCVLRRLTPRHRSAATNGVEIGNKTMTEWVVPFWNLIKVEDE